MIVKAILQHGSSYVVDLPLGDYDSGDGPLTVLEKVVESEDLGLGGVYWKVKLHAPKVPEEEQAYNEFANIYIRPLGMVLKDVDSKRKITFNEGKYHVRQASYFDEATKYTNGLCTDILTLKNAGTQMQLMERFRKTRVELFKLVNDLEMAKKDDEGEADLVTLPNAMFLARYDREKQKLVVVDLTVKNYLDRLGEDVVVDDISADLWDTINGCMRCFMYDNGSGLPITTEVSLCGVVGKRYHVRVTVKYDAGAL